MIKVSWGTKRFCLSCSRKFFDLNRKNIECPYCGSAFSEEESLKNMLPKRGPKKSKEPVAEESVEKPEQPLGEFAGNIDEIVVAKEEDSESETESSDISEGEDASEVPVTEEDQAEDVEKIDDEVEKDDKSIDLEDFETDEGEVSEVIDVGDQKKGDEEQ
ncbi:MAG: TIGR02300 family protein [Pseudomonadota bacterium]|nr:TIGR02300 family protein [Pseudomonadota bacterium]